MQLENLLDIINEINLMKGEQVVDDVKLDTSLRKDLGFDSIDLATLTAKIEDAYNIDIFEDGIVDTIQEIMDKLKGNE